MESTLDLLHWAVALALLAFFLACAWSNLDNLFDLSTANRRRVVPSGNRVSPIMFLGGLSGAAALWLWPQPDLKWLAWLPFLIDFPGTLGIGRAGPEAEAPVQSQAERTQAEAAERARIAEAEARLAFFERAIVGCLLGTAVGDALGLHCEGLSPARQRRLFAAPGTYHLLPFGRGMCSDDTEHTVMLAQSICESPECTEDERQAREVAGAFAWRLRFWFLGLPAGIGLATLRAIVKLWLFIPPRWSGVHSAGNAPAMRSALLGLVYGEQPARLEALVRAATRITHTDPKAELAAWTVAVAARQAAVSGGRTDATAFLRACLAPDGQAHALANTPAGAEWRALLERVAASVGRGEATTEFARALGLERGVTGYAYHSVPVALHAWLAHPGDYAGAVLAAIECGGDTDTVAAITGAIAGAGTGRAGIPAPFLDRLVEWPRTVAWMERLGVLLARRAATGMPQLESVPPAGAVKLLLRNALFMLIVLAHGFRRLLPPY